MLVQCRLNVAAFMQQLGKLADLTLLITDLGSPKISKNIYKKNYVEVTREYGDGLKRMSAFHR